jgi:hypothetical protein
MRSFTLLILTTASLICKDVVIADTVGYGVNKEVHQLLTPQLLLQLLLLLLQEKQQQQSNFCLLTSMQQAQNNSFNQLSG